MADAALVSKVTELSFVDRIPERTFSVEGVAWEDHTADPTASGTDDLALVTHDAEWRPGVHLGGDGRLLDVAAGALRRIPFDGDTVVAGGFAGDRTKVLAVGARLHEEVGVFVVDLRTRASRRVGAGFLDGLKCFAPALSPDGKTLAVCQLSSGAVRIALVDVETDEGRYVDGPSGGATVKLAWTSDGRALLVTQAFSPGPLSPVSRVSRLSLDGKVTPIRDRVDMVQLVDDGTRLLFRDLEDGKWATCDLDGKDKKVYGKGGLADCLQLAVSPDDRRVLGVRALADQSGLELVVIDKRGRGDPQRAVEAPGAVIYPIWR